MTDIRQLLGKNIKFYRNSCCLTQAKLAEKANTTTNYISAIESGRRFPSVEILKKIALALEIDTPKLFIAEKIDLAAMRNEIREQIWQVVGQNLSEYIEKRLEEVRSEKGKMINNKKTGKRKQIAKV